MFSGKELQEKEKESKFEEKDIMCFKRKEKKSQFVESALFWGGKLRAFTHHLQSLMRHAGDKKEQLQDIISDYITITDRLFDLTKSHSQSNDE